MAYSIVKPGGFNPLKPLYLVSLLALLLAALYLARADALVWHWLHARITQSVPATLQFDRYRVVIEARPMADIDDFSGLTYHSGSHTLFAVLNQAPQIIELDLQGRVLRRINVDGVHDMEGITHVDGNRFVVADEHDHRLILLEIGADSTTVDAARSPQLQLALGPYGKNKGIEGISWDEQHHRLLVAKERKPLQLIEIRGFIDGDPADARVTHITPAGFAALRLRDFSSVSYHDASGSLVLLSDESRMAVEYDADGRALSALSLWRGFHGLQKNVPQAEGIAIGPDGRVYLVSEPNLFYVFAPAD